MDNIKGLWWLPEKEELKISGDLIYTSGQKATLSLDDSFKKEKRLDKSEDFYEIILGEINGQKITLVNSKKISSTVTLTGYGDTYSIKFSPIVICKGFHFLNKKELEFTKVLVRYSHIRKWLGPHTGFKKEDNPYLKGFIETSLVVQILPNLRLEIKDFLQKDNVKIYNSHNDKTTVLFSFPQEKLSISDILETLDIFRNFLQILIDEKIEVLEIEAQEEYGNIQLILPNIVGSEFKDSIAFIPEPITIRTFQENPESYLSNWFNFTEKFKPIYQLFFSDNYEQLYITTRFLLYAQAIEAFHQRSYDNKLFPKNLREILDEFTSFSEITKVMFHQEVADSILGTFYQINRKVLKVRLKELFEDYALFFEVFIRDRNSFINDFTDARNYYTHYNPESSMSEPSYSKMVVLTENSRFILLSIFLKESGFKESDIVSALYRYCRKRVTDIKSLR